MWSQVSRKGEKLPPQNAQMKRSRLKSSRLFNGGTWVKTLIASALPRIAMIELAGMVQRSPVRGERPPETLERFLPFFPTTSLLLGKQKNLSLGDQSGG